MNRLIDRLAIVHLDSGGTQEVGSLEARPGGMSEVMVVDIADSSLLEDTIAKIVGWSRRATGGGFLVRRTPIRHPDRTWLRAVAVSGVRGYRFNGYAQSRLGALTGVVVPTPFYTKKQAQILFESLPYAVKEDNDLPSVGYTDREFDRYVTTRWQPSSRFITRQDRFFAFENESVQFKQGVGVLIGEATIQWTWYGLPTDAIFNGAGIPTRAFELLGKINAGVFPSFQPSDGFGTGKLLLESIQLEPRMVPVPPEYLLAPEGESPPTASTVPRVWDVTFTVRYTTLPSHNHAPHPSPGAGELFRKIVVASDAGFGTVGNPSLYQSADFSNLFRPL